MGITRLTRRSTLVIPCADWTRAAYEGYVNSLSNETPNAAVDLLNRSFSRLMRCCFNLRILRALAAAAALRRCSAATETPKSAACNWWRPCCPGGRLGIPTTLVHTPERRATSPRFRPRVRTRAVSQTTADSRRTTRGSTAVRHLAQQIMT